MKIWALILSQSTSKGIRFGSDEYIRDFKGRLLGEYVKRVQDLQLAYVAADDFVQTIIQLLINNLFSH
jgi:hypothetical protein